MERQSLENKTEGLEERIIIGEKTLVGEHVSEERKQLLKEIGEELIDNIRFEVLSFEEMEKRGFLDSQCTLDEDTKIAIMVENSFKKKIRIDYLKFNPSHFVVKACVWVSPYNRKDYIESIILDKGLLNKIRNISSTAVNLDFLYRDMKVQVFYDYVGNPFAGIKF